MKVFICRPSDQRVSFSQRVPADLTIRKGNFFNMDLLRVGAGTKTRNCKLQRPAHHRRWEDSRDPGITEDGQVCDVGITVFKKFVVYLNLYDFSASCRALRSSLQRR